MDREARGTSAECLTWIFDLVLDALAMSIRVVEKESFSKQALDLGSMGRMLSALENNAHELPANLFDSHCHLDRILSTAQLQQSEPFQRLRDSKRTEFSPLFEGCLTNCCDPEQFDSPVRPGLAWPRLSCLSSLLNGS